MKDILRQPDGKIRTACKFCRQRKKRCSGEMPCASCVNFNRDCCVYERWSSSPSVPKLKEAPATLAAKMPWLDQTPATPPTKPCFTSRVVLRQIQNQKNIVESTSNTNTPSLDKENDFTANSLLQSPFKPLSLSSTSSVAPTRRVGSKQKARAMVQDENSPLDFMSSTFSSPTMSPSLALSFNLVGETSAHSPPFDSPSSYMSMPLTPLDAMTRTISLPAFYDRSWTSSVNLAPDESPPLFEGSMTAISPLVGGSYSMSKTTSMPAHFDVNSWSQPSTPSSLSSSSLATTAAADDLTAMLTPSWYPTSSCDQYLPGLLANDADTKQFLQDVDALLLEYGSNSSQSSI